MKLNTLIVLGLALLSPLAASGAESARQELARVYASVPDAERGAEAFRACVSCHGTDGAGQASGDVPRIAGQHYRVLVQQLVDFRRGRRWDFRMEAIAGKHDTLSAPQTIADLAWHVSQLDAGGPRGVGQGDYVETGDRIYSMHCASCHGVRGEGDDAKSIPRIAGQHAGYLSRQIYDAVDGRRPPLTRTHARRFKELEFEEVLGLSDYLSRIGWHSEKASATRLPGQSDAQE